MTGQHGRQKDRGEKTGDKTQETEHAGHDRDTTETRQVDITFGLAGAVT